MADPTILQLYVAAGGDPDVTDPSGTQLYQAIVALSAGAGGINWRGAYNGATAYAQGDGVSRAGAAYLALAASTGSQPPSANWQAVIVAGPAGATGATGADGPAGPAGGLTSPLADDVDADGHTVKNLADPDDDGDAVPKGYAGFLPTADPLTASIDTTTYDNPAHFDGATSEKLRTFMLSEYDVAVAIAKVGDDFPRLLYVPEDNAIYLGDGTFQPYAGPGLTLRYTAGQAELIGPAGGRVYVEPDGSIFLQPPDDTFDGTALNVGDVNLVNRSTGLITANRGIQPGTGLGAPAVTSGPGAPAIGGEVGDIFIRGNPSGANETIYRCTVAGIGGVATWVGIL